MGKTSSRPGESHGVIDSCAEWNCMQTTRGSAGAQAGKQQIIPWGAGWSMHRGGGMDLDLREGQAFKEEGTAEAKAQRLGAHSLIGR